MANKRSFAGSGYRALAVLVCAALAGCAAVTTTKENGQPVAGPKNGLSYFLPKGKVIVMLGWNPILHSWDVSPTVVIEPDTTERFDLDWSNSLLSDKDTTVAVDPTTGLLQSIDATAPGQSINSVGALVGAAPNINRLSTTGAPVSSYAGAGFTDEDYLAFSKLGPSSPSAGEVEYAPTAQIVVDDNDHLQGYALVSSPEKPRRYAAVRVTLTRKFELGSGFPQNKHQRLSDQGTGGGIAVRMPMPFELRVSELISSDPTFRDRTKPRTTADIASRIVMLPDSKHDFIYRVLSRPLVADSTRIALSNGMINSLEQVRPSMLAAVLALPKYIITGVTPLPFEITQSQQTISNAQSKIANDQGAAGTATEQR